MITLEDYFGPWLDHVDASPPRCANAEAFLPKVTGFLEEAVAAGVPLKKNPLTGTYISGTTFGGFRPLSCRQGEQMSSHKSGRGIDIADKDNALDNWISSFDADRGGRNEVLERHGLYRADPDNTPAWCHLTDRAPGSQRRTFKA